MNRSTACLRFRRIAARIVSGLVMLACGPAATAAATPAAASGPAFAHFTYQVWNTGNGLPQDTVRQFLQATDGYLWMATDGGLVRFDGFDFTTFDRRNTPLMQSDLVNSLFQDSAGNLWIATSNGLLEEARGKFRRFAAGEGLPSDSVLSVRQDGDGRICASTSAGSACLAGNSFVVQPADKRQDAAKVPPHAVAADGTLWTVTATGLAGVKNGKTSTVAMPEGFSGSDVLALYIDREGNVWAGSESAGAAIVRSPPFTTIGQKDGLAADQVRSLFESNVEDKGRDIWFGTSSGLGRLHDGLLTAVKMNDAGGAARGGPGLASDEIITLAGSGPGDLWVGTPDGLSHIRTGGITTLTASDGLPDDNIRSLLEVRDHSLWIGTTHGLAHLPAGTGAGSNIRTYTTADGLGSDVIGSLLEDADGSLWIGTRAGLGHLQNGRIGSYGESAGLRSGIITALGLDHGGNMWVGTAGGGLYAWDRERSRLMRVSAGAQLPDTIYGILDDGLGYTWLSSPDGIYRIATNQLHDLAEGRSAGTMPAIRRYDVSDGLRINDCGSGGHPEAIRTQDGRLFFATGKGVSVVQPGSAALHQPVPPVVLETISVDDATEAPTPEIRIAAGHDRVAFHYAGISLFAPSKVRYRYQLEHFDRTWIEAGTRRTAYYTNIPPGRYRFRVLASTSGSQWSEVAAEIDVVIEPHYYQTWWFYSLFAMLFALAAWQLYLYRLRQVELRFDAVLAERGRIAREIHDTLAQDIVAISVQLDLVSRLMTLSAEKAREQLTAARDLVRKSLAEARSSIWDLRSPSATGTDLPSRLREVTRHVVGDAAVKLNLHITGTYRPCSRTIEDELLRIAQEAVTNAVRHAASQQIDVSLTYNTAGVDLLVQDDGRGFTIAGEAVGPAGHFGLRGMQERAERARARLHIESSPGAGTRVRASADIP